MTSNSVHKPAWRRMRFIAVSLLAQPQHDVHGLVGTSKLNSLMPNIHRLEIYGGRRHPLTSLKSIGDPERNSDREKRSNDRNRSGDSAGNNSKRRRRNNGKYNRQRRSNGSQNPASDKPQEKENTVSKGKESKIRTSANNSLKQFSSGPPVKPKDKDDANSDNPTIEALTKRVIQLETLVSSQMSEMQKLRREMDQMASTMGDVVNFVDQLQSFVSEESITSFDDKKNTPAIISSDKSQPLFDDDFEIFGVAPTTIKDAADSAGQSILSAILAGKHRMLVDVRDAELTRDPALLVEFIELAVLPVAAGLQGLDAYTNRVKIVFPTVEELLGYRKYMALAAPEVVSLSTLGFDPVEEKDNLIVIIAPSPDDVAGCEMMQKLLERMSPNADKPLSRPVVIINHHMMPIDTGNIGKFTVVYHLRLLSVQYMTGDIVPEYVNEKEGDEEEKDSDGLEKSEGDSALEAAMTHAREIGVHQVKCHAYLNAVSTPCLS